MKYFLIMSLLYTLSLADLTKISSFEAEFSQTITDEKGETLSYSGVLKALKPQFALWDYKKPVEKRVYIQRRSVTLVEPELEQVIVRRIAGNFDFFTLINSAEKLDNNHYIAKFEESDILITLQDSKLLSLSYKDKFDNDVRILFSNQVQNIQIPIEVFDATYPGDYDIIAE